MKMKRMIFGKKGEGGSQGMNIFLKITLWVLFLIIGGAVIYSSIIKPFFGIG